MCVSLSPFFSFSSSPSLSLSVSLPLPFPLSLSLSLSLSPYSEGHDREDLFLPNLQDKFLLGIKDSLAAVGSSAPFIVVVMSGSSVDLTVAKVQCVYNTCYASTHCGLSLKSILPTLLSLIWVSHVCIAYIRPHPLGYTHLIKFCGWRLIALFWEWVWVKIVVHIASAYQHLHSCRY